jgi:hypothetical protein
MEFKFLSRLGMSSQGALSIDPQRALFFGPVNRSLVPHSILESIIGELLAYFDPATSHPRINLDCDIPEVNEEDSEKHSKEESEGDRKEGHKEDVSIRCVF